MDKLATEEIVFTNNYVQPLCTPSRHSLMTGRYPYRSGMQHNVIRVPFPKCSGLQYKMLPEYLKELEYDTHIIGKWHLGSCRLECMPTYRGFDTFFGGLAGGAD